MGLFVKQDTLSTETLLSLSCRAPTFFTVAVHVGNYLYYFLFWAKNEPLFPSINLPVFNFLCCWIVLK